MAGVALVVVLAGLGIAVFATAVTPRGSSQVIAPGADESAAPFASATIYVHILGEVRRPGLYALRDGDRAVDAVAAAGGFTEAADAAGLNLARVVSDGEQIVVPAMGAVTAAPGVTADGRVNLNTADAATLDTLPGIGPATAAKILAWRERNGRFASVDDLLDVVGGIGEAKLDALRDLVTV